MTNKVSAIIPDLTREQAEAVQSPRHREFLMLVIRGMIKVDEINADPKLVARLNKVCEQFRQDALEEVKKMPPLGQLQ